MVSTHFRPIIFNPKHIDDCLMNYFMLEKPENFNITDFCHFLMENFKACDNLCPLKYMGSFFF